MIRVTHTRERQRYRQRGVGKVNQLEEELEIIKAERDQLETRVSELVGETDGLKRLLDSKGEL
jgi:chaperonin cofactor prefoldin